MVSKSIESYNQFRANLVNWLKENCYLYVTSTRTIYKKVDNDTVEKIDSDELVDKIKVVFADEINHVCTTSDKRYVSLTLFDVSNGSLMPQAETLPFISKVQVAARISCLILASEKVEDKVLQQQMRYHVITCTNMLALWDETTTTEQLNGLFLEFNRDNPEARKFM